MRYKVRLGYLLAYFFAIAISLLLSYFVSQSDFHYRTGSDLPAYEEFYYCLMSDTVDTCKLLIASNYEYVFYLIFSLISSTELSFPFALFFISFFIYSSLLIITIKLSSNRFNLYWLALGFLLIDFRFYDYGFNIIRHGIASALMMFATLFYILNFSKIRYALLCIPNFAHLSALSQLILFTHFKLLHSRAFWFFLLPILYIISQLLSNILSFVSGIDYIGSKISYYTASHREHAWLPVQYILILMLSLLLNIKNSTYLIVRKVFLTLIAMSIIFITTGMSYRFVAYSMPFSAILLSYHFSYMINVFAKKYQEFVFLVLLAFFAIYGISYFYKYNSFILSGLK